MSQTQKRIFINTICLVSLFLVVYPVFAERVVPNSSPDFKMSKYDYKGDDLPGVCFFPKDEARWDGYKVNDANWYELTNYQKETFISEGITEIEKNENVTITVENKWRILNSVNTEVNMMLDRFPGIKKPMIDILSDCLKDAGYIKRR